MRIAFATMYAFSATVCSAHALASMPADPGQGALMRISGASPWPTDCSYQTPDFRLSHNSEVEPFIAVNPRDRRNMFAGWQQDRWTWFGANGQTGAVTFRHW